MSNVTRMKGKTGPRVGQPHSGQFQKGEDSRRYVPSSERGRIRKTVEELCKQHAEDAVQYLAELLADPSANHKERIVAASELLDRGFGKSVDRVAIQQVGTAQGSLKDADMDTLMATLQVRIGSELGQEPSETSYLKGEYTELNGSDNRHDAGDD